tara:strand:+ start:316 stop:1113 length:798 start_codon:yes stop_codon:yes gene_type:complete
MQEVTKWVKTIQYQWTISLAYRLNFFLEITAPVLVFFFVQYNLWSSIYGNDPNLIIKGYSKAQMISYFGWTLVVGMISRGHMSGNIAEDIRLGRISAHLIYPFDFWKYHTANFLGFQSIQLFIACFSFVLLIYFGAITPPNISTIMMATIYCIYVSFFWFTIQFLIGILAFWLSETWILRVIFNLITAFLAGTYFPLEIYPPWFQKILNILPFSYIQYYPVKIFMGETHLLPKSIFMISIWIIPAVALTKYCWKRGVMRYTAAGM